VRKNLDGTLYTLNYARAAALHLDPMEKKPLFHFHPGTTILSAGAPGCNLACAFCQNWELSQAREAVTEMGFSLPPEEFVALALRYREEGRACVGLAYTYSEPTVWFEYVRDTARLARSRGLKNVMVTNGFISPEPLEELLKLIDAFNVDVKGMDPRYYTRICRGRLDPVLRTVETIHRAGRHVEVTNLLVTGENTGEEEVRKLVDWLSGVSPDLPLHFSRYFPAYRMNNPPTPLEVLDRARKIARQRLRYVYLGNTWRPGDDDTRCPGCGELLVAREGYRIRVLAMEEGRCASCGEEIYGEWG
jgi:pyruvate formate lyase activating enzyme